MASTSTVSPNSLSGFARRHSGEIGLALAVLAVVGFTALLNDSYVDKPALNAQEILRQTSLLGIFALGAAVVIISGGIDLSSGSMIAFSSAVCAALMIALVPTDQYGIPVTEEIPFWILAAAVAGTMLAALCVGTVHAWLITVVGLPPFVATLASLVGLRSLARVLVQDVTAAVSSQGESTQIYIYDETFRMLFNVWWIPPTVFLALAALLWLVMSRTVTGRHLYAMGGNEAAARLSGIRTDRLKWLAYCIGTGTAAIAGILHCSYVGMSDPATDGMGYELNAIAAAVVGGCSLQGGIGTIGGTMLGALFLQVAIDSVAKTVRSNPSEFQGLIVGGLVILAVAFNELRSRGLLRKQFFPGVLGTTSLVILSGLAGVVVAVLSTTNKSTYGVTAAGTVLLLLGFRKLVERRAAAR